MTAEEKRLLELLAQARGQAELDHRKPSGAAVVLGFPSSSAGGDFFEAFEAFQRASVSAEAVEAYRESRKALTHASEAMAAAAEKLPLSVRQQIARELDEETKQNAKR